jgi:phosphoribosylaminoimidazole (AIR) synthetase
MYQVFNMGIGMVAIVSRRDADRAKSLLKAIEIGCIERGTAKTRLVF